MPVPLAAGIATAIWAGLASVIIPLAVRLLVGIGFYTVTFVGIGAAWDAAKAAIATNLGGTSESIIAILAMARIDDGIQVVLSAGGAVLLAKGLNTVTGGITRANWRKTVVGG